MREWRLRTLGVCLTIGLLVSLTQSVQAQDAASAAITAPKSGDAVSGNNVTITGTAANTSLKSYVLEFADQQVSPEQWFPIAPPVTQSVTNGPLGRWDTTTIPDGKYEIRLRVVKRDGTQIITVVKDLNVLNRLPTALPTIPPTPTIQGANPPTAGPSPTSAIQQPPTDTPHPSVPVTATPLPAPVANIPPASGTIDLSALGNAFCGGAWLSVIGFGLFGAYSLIRGRLRNG
jgi:hypothetical protein